MGAASSAYITCTAGGKTAAWHFAGVTAIGHSLSLELGKEASRGADIVNGARNRPDRVTLSVIETDTVHGPGGAARMLEAMNTLKKNRSLCRVVTSLGTYRKMLLTEITATQDGENQCGWTGALVFVEYVSGAGDGAAVKTNTNSSVRTNTGSAGAAKKITGTAFQQLLQRAGINEEFTIHNS